MTRTRKIRNYRLGAGIGMVLGLAAGCSGGSESGSSASDDIATGAQQLLGPPPPGHPDHLCVPATFGGKDYFVCHGDRSYVDAQQKCRSVGMELVAIESAAEDTWLTAQIDEHVWIGSTDKTSARRWAWTATGEVFWDSGPVSGAYSNFEHGDPDWGISGDCAAKNLIGGDWETFDCALPNAYVCEEPDDTTPPETGCEADLPPDVKTVTAKVFATADTYVDTLTPNKPHAAESTLQVASGPTRKAALVHFSEAAIAAAIGESLDNAKFVSASLVIPTAPFSIGGKLDAHALLRGYTDARATWNCASDTNTANSTLDCPAADRWNLAGSGAFAPTPTASSTLSATSTQASFDVTADVAKLFEEDLANNGWIIRSPDLLAAVNLEANTTGAKGARLELKFEVKQPKPAWQRIQHRLSCQPPGSGTSITTYATLVTQRIACAVARGEAGTDLTRMFEAELASIPPAELPGVLAKARAACDVIDDMPADVREGLLGPLAPFDPWKAGAAAPSRDDLVGVKGAFASGGRPPRLRANFCGDGVAADPAAVTIDLTPNGIAPDSDELDYRPSDASPVVEGVRPITLDSGRGGDFVGHGSLVTDWQTNRSDLSPDGSRFVGGGLNVGGVDTGISCLGAPAACDNAQGLRCEGVGSFQTCRAYPVVFKSDLLGIIGHNMWDTKDAVLVLKSVDQPLRAPKVIPLDSLLNMEDAVGDLNCQPRTLTDKIDLDKQIARFSLADVAVGEYEVFYFNRNGTFKAQHDDAEDPGRVIHVCPSRCIADPNGAASCPVCASPSDTGCYVGTCASPVASTCPQDAEAPAGSCTAASGAWTGAPRPLADCEHNPLEPARCKETPEWFGSETAGARIFIRNHPATYEVGTTLHSVKCEEESGVDWPGDDEFSARLMTFNIEESAFPVDAFRSQHRAAEATFENFSFDEDERSTPDKLMGQGIRFRADQSVLFIQNLREDDADLKGWNIFVSALSGAAGGFGLGLLGGYIGGPVGGAIGAAGGGAIVYAAVRESLEGFESADNLGDTVWIANANDMIQRIQRSRGNDFLVPGGFATTLGAMTMLDDQQVIVEGQPLTFTAAGSTTSFLTHPFDVRGGYLDSPASCECGAGCTGQSCTGTEGVCVADRCDASFSPLVDCIVDGTPTCWRESRKTSGDGARYHLHYQFSLKSCNPEDGSCVHGL